MTPYLPLVVRFSQRKCVVIGGGAVAARRARTLSEAGADVLVAAPELSEEIEELVAAGAVRALRRTYSADLLQGAFLVVVATSDPAVNARIAADAAALGVLVNDADEPDRGDCIIPAAVRRGDLLIAVTTCGASPSLASRIRDGLATEFGPEYEAYVALLGEVRDEALKRIETPAGRKRALATLASDPDILELIRAGQPEEARSRAFDCISPSSD